MTTIHLYGSSSAEPRGAEKYFIQLLDGQIGVRQASHVWQQFWLWLRLVADCICYGPFVALQIKRLATFDVQQGTEYMLHRSLACPYFLRRPHLLPQVSVVLHNVEATYYLEEAQAESKWFKKCLYLVQYLYLRRYEVTWLRQFKRVYHLSAFEHRCLRRQGVVSHPYFQMKLPAQLGPCQWDGKRVFFGDFTNVRNYRALQALPQSLHGVHVYGRNPHNLPIPGYLGAFSSVAELRRQYAVLSNPVQSRAGIQTKVFEWLLAGGCAEVKSCVYFQFPPEARHRLRIIR